jgi:hypothetical protein
MLMPLGRGSVEEGYETEMPDISNLDLAIDDVEVNNADQSQPCEELREESGFGNSSGEAVDAEDVNEGSRQSDDDDQSRRTSANHAKTLPGCQQ